MAKDGNRGEEGGRRCVPDAISDIRQPSVLRRQAGAILPGGYHSGRARIMVSVIRESCGVVLFCPPLSVGDHRPETLLKAVEETIGESLNVAWERDTTRRLSDRIAYITEKIQSGGPIPAFSNGRPKWAEAVSLTWLTWPDGPGRQRRLRFVLTIPITIADRHGEELIQVLGIRAQAWWGYLATPGLGVLALQQTRRPWGEPIPPKGLPVLCGEEEMDVIVRPHQFGWLNYWSEEAAGLQGIAASGVRNGVEV